MSGSGKTTLANIIVGLLKPENGTLYYNERKLDFFDEGIFNIKNKIAYLSQESFIFNDTIKKTSHLICLRTLMIILFLKSLLD